MGSFNLEEFDVSPEHYAATDVQEDTFGAPQQAETVDFDDQMSEVEKRLEVASYFKLLLNGGLFNETTPAAVAVEKEVREFITARLKVLLGVTNSEVIRTRSEFTPEQTEALKALANQILKQKTTVKKPEKATPSLRQAMVPEAPSRKTAETPSLKRAPIPAVAQKPTSVPAKPPSKRKNNVVSSPHAIAMPQGSAFSVATATIADNNSRATLTDNPFGAQLINAAMKQ